MLSKKNLISALFFAGIFVFMVSFSLIVKKTPLLADEVTHYSTIWEIQNNKINSETFTRNAQVPGYYFLIAAIGFVTKLDTLFQLRMISLVFSFMSIIAFYLLARKIDHKESLLKTSLYLFFPLYFVFFFLLYGDVISLLILMLSFLFVLNKKYFFAGIFGLISLLFRQNNIIWLGFFCAYIFAEDYRFDLRLKNIKPFLKDISLFIVGLLGMIIFVLINKSPALAQTSLNPIVFRQENVFFMLFIYFFVFLPEIIYKLPKISSFIKKHYYILFMLAGIFVYYIAFFKVDHWFNDPVYFHIFIRNKILSFPSENLVNKTIFFIPIAFSILSLTVTSLYKKSFYLLYPFIFLFLSMSWMIEQRYTMIPFLFLILFKKRNPLRVGYFTLGINILICAFLAWGVFSNVFFL